MKLSVRKKIRMSFEKYSKFLAKIGKEYNVNLVINPIAKEVGEFIVDYKYRIEILNWKGSGHPGIRLIFPIKLSPKNFVFEDFTSTDCRVQLTKEEVREDLDKFKKYFEKKFNKKLIE